VNLSAATAAEVPPGVVTLTSTVPVPFGDLALITVAETTFEMTPLVLPKVTAVAPLKFFPVMVTAVPPAAAPPFGPIFVTEGLAS
jgi:hypothetical protein